MLCYYVGFDIQFQDWDIDTAQLKEPTTTCWIEEWEKERHKKNDTVSKAMFVSKYRHIVFDLPDAAKSTFCSFCKIFLGDYASH